MGAMIELTYLTKLVIIHAKFLPFKWRDEICGFMILFDFLRNNKLKESFYTFF